jgi:type VI secretion system protein ImpA
MISIAKFLEPITPEKPCGENLAYDQAFLDLQVKLRGKEETQFSPAEEPNWKEVLELSTGLLGRFRHLQVGVTFTLALVQTEGLPGFRDGLSLLRGWIEKYWEPVYPLLDPEDSNDPTERINILQTLSVTTFGDAYRFCDRLAKVPLCESKTLGKYSLQQIRAGSGGAGAAEASAAPAAGPAQAEAAFRDTPQDLRQNRFDAVTESLAALKEMDSMLRKLVGADRAPNFEALRKTLEEIRACLAPYVILPAGETEAAGQASPSQPEKGDGRSGAGLKKTIDSRDDVVQALRAICDYYQRREPSSPIPFLLQRAQRLVNMDFLQIVNDLAPDSIAQMKLITGVPPEKTEKA